MSHGPAISVSYSHSFYTVHGSFLSYFCTFVLIITECEDCNDQCVFRIPHWASVITDEVRTPALNTQMCHFFFRVSLEVVPCPRQLDAGLSLQRHGFSSRPVCVGFVVDTARAQVFLRVLRFSLVSIIPPIFYTRSFTCHSLTPYEVSSRRC